LTSFVVRYCVGIAIAKHIKSLRVVSIRKQGFKTEDLILTLLKLQLALIQIANDCKQLRKR